MEPTESIANLANVPMRTQKLNKPTPFMSASNVYALSTKVDLVKYLHIAFWIPNPDTWFKSIDQGFFATFPGLTTALVKQHLPKSVATQKGHMKMARKNVRSTKSTRDSAITKIFMTEQDDTTETCTRNNLVN